MGSHCSGLHMQTERKMLVAPGPVALTNRSKLVMTPHSYGISRTSRAHLAHIARISPASLPRPKLPLSARGAWIPRIPFV